MSGSPFQRKLTRQVLVGRVPIGGGSPISIQSMTTTPTADAAATLAQIRALAEGGCDIVRLAVASAADSARLGEIVRASPVPIVADVHFQYRRALEAVAAGVHKVRLNPGTLRDRRQVLTVIRACQEAGVPIRVGVNAGSVRRALVPAAQPPRGQPPAGAPAREKPPEDPAGVEAMLRALTGYLEVFEQAGFRDLVLSAKSHDAPSCVAVYRRLSERFDYPLHLGLTHAGTAQTGLVRSAAALGTLLAEGIGDTIRISLAGDPLAEVAAAKELLASLHLRPRDAVEVIACPTCGRTRADVAGLAEEVRRALAGVRRHVLVAVMGCVVNGPGEAEGADVACCCGRTRAAIYRRGVRRRSVALDSIVPALVEEVRTFLRE